MTLRTKIINRDDPSSLIKFNILQDHIRQDDLYDEELMNLMYLAAIDRCEKYTNRVFTKATVIAVVPEFRENIILPYSPTKVLSVKAKSFDNDTAVDIPFVFNTISEEVSFNNFSTKKYYDIEVQYECGYEQGELPWVIKQAILMTFGTIYNVREDVSFGVSVNALPFHSKLLLDPYKIPLSGG